MELKHALLHQICSDATLRGSFITSKKICFWLKKRFFFEPKKNIFFHQKKIFFFTKKNFFFVS